MDIHQDTPEINNIIGSQDKTMGLSITPPERASTGSTSQTRKQEKNAKNIVIQDVAHEEEGKKGEEQTKDVYRHERDMRESTRKPIKTSMIHPVNESSSPGEPNLKISRARIARVA